MQWVFENDICNGFLKMNGEFFQWDFSMEIFENDICNGFLKINGEFFQCVCVFNDCDFWAEWGKIVNDIHSQWYLLNGKKCQ